ncbi:MAG: hypothetical protein AB1465_07205 [Patescibacteria group bacterium]
MLDNIYFIISLVIILSFLDYFLTLKYVKLAKEVLAKHVEIEEYELNPNFQKNIREGKYNLRHLRGIIRDCLVLVVLYFFVSKISSTFYYTLFHFAEGIVLGEIIITNSFHIGQILEIKYLKSNSSLLSGKWKNSYLYSLTKERYRTISLLVLVFLLLILKPSTFIFGVFISQIFALLTLKIWRKQYLRKLRSKPAPSS